ncbi:MAG TPA: SoxXA-binding protein [Gammaproteobacteria bacterium]
MKKYLLPLLASALLASGCASSPTTSSSAASTPTASVPAKSTATAQQASAAIAAAEQRQAQAAKAGYEWRDTGKLIEEAKKAAAASDFDSAVALATRAEHQGALALKQQASELQRLNASK